MSRRFLERLEHGPVIVADGGMGALITSAVPRLRCPEEATSRAPGAVVWLHVGYTRAGGELIETNTFGANRRKLASQYLENEFEAINSTAARLAREAREISGKEVFIGGSIGPLGELGNLPVKERAEVFAEQATVLEGRGADVFVIETFFDLEELETAIAAVQTVSSLPIVALLTFDEEAETLAGVGARQAAQRLAGLDVAAIGANHGAGPQAALAALEQMRQDGRPLVAMPNIGLASLAGGDVSGMLEVARALRESGLVDVVDINENSGARAAMSANVVAAAIERTVGMETIPHVTSRDSTIMGLESILLGAHAEGIRNVLAVTGDPPEVGDYPGSRGVYEVDAVGLVQLMAHLNRGEDFNGRAIDAATSFHIGVAVNPSADDLDLELERYRRKIDAGAH